MSTAAREAGQLELDPYEATQAAEAFLAATGAVESSEIAVNDEQVTVTVHARYRSVILP